MKKVFLFFILAGFIAKAQSQQLNTNEVPSIITDAFSLSHPEVKEVKWYQDNANFEARFEIASNENAIIYDSWANTVEVKTEISTNDLSVCIADYVLRNYPDSKIIEAEKVTMEISGITTYEITVSDMVLTFAKTCAFISEKKSNK